MAGDYERRMLRVVEHIHAHPAGDLSLDALAEVAAMSRFHWHRVFTAMTGETCAQAVRRVRLHKAAAALVRTDRPIAEIAAEVGYPNLASFSRAFERAYGLPPGAFRSRGDFPPLLNHARTGDYPMFPIEIATQPARRLAAMPHRGAYIEIGKTFESVGAIAAARNLWPHVRGMIGVYYDDPDAKPEAELRSAAGLAVTYTAPIAEPLQEIRLPEGRYAVMHYKGPYPGLAAAYKHLYGVWLPESGEEAGDHPPIEVYLNAPQDTAPEDLLTDVCVPLKD
ncbi:helix-turn-helix domain-containing protein [Rhodobacterales bacterium HKCCE3408]|nr:helix-turn-helix domain-containing protein [Rhodobacterales bacterium HKCCE3408]